MRRITRRGSTFALGLTALALAGLMAAMPGAAAAKDVNRDGIPDRWERKHGLSLKVDQARKDQDRDHVRNLAEFTARFDPMDADSDGDGVADNEEGYRSRIVAWDPSTHTVTVAELWPSDNPDGTTSGLITDRTDLRCQTSPTQLAAEAPATGAGDRVWGDWSEDIWDNHSEPCEMSQDLVGHTFFKSTLALESPYEPHVFWDLGIK